MKSHSAGRRGLSAVLVALVLAGPTVPLLGVAVLLAPADTAYCLNQTPPPLAYPVEPLPGPSNERVAVPETTSLVRPLTGLSDTVVSQFDPPPHTGVDLAVAESTPILVIADGVVAEAGVTPDGTQRVAVEHTVQGETVTSVYENLTVEGADLTTGQWLVAGQHIANVGRATDTTGHLHFEIRLGGATAPPVDPLEWLEDRTASRLTAPRFGGPRCGHGMGIPGSPNGLTGPTGGRLPDPTGTGGFVTSATAHLIAQTRAVFPTSRWSCWAARPGTSSQHPLGRACDVTFGNRLGVFPTPAQVAEGWRMTLWLQQNAAALHVEYLIWQRLVWSVARNSEGWRTYDGGGMHDPTTPTGGHYDHLHITVKP